LKLIIPIAQLTNKIQPKQGTLQEDVPEQVGEKIWAQFEMSLKLLGGEAYTRYYIQPPPSGFTKSSMLLELRKKFYIEDEIEKAKEKFGKEATDKFGTGARSNPTKKKQRAEYIQSQMITWSPSEFDDEYYPKSWLVFCYLGNASNLPDNDEDNPFKTRSQSSQNIQRVEDITHQYYVRNIELSLEKYAQ